MFWYIYEFDCPYFDILQWAFLLMASNINNSWYFSYKHKLTQISTFIVQPLQSSQPQAAACHFSDGGSFIGAQLSLHTVGTLLCLHLTQGMTFS